jgi:hypothetical protein
MSLLSVYAASGTRTVDTSHGAVVGKFRGFTPSDGATISELFVNNIAVDAKADYGWEIALAGNILRMMKEGDIITSITFSVGQAEMING